MEQAEFKDGIRKILEKHGEPVDNALLDKFAVDAGPIIGGVLNPISWWARKYSEWAAGLMPSTFVQTGFSVQAFAEHVTGMSRAAKIHLARSEAQRADNLTSSVTGAPANRKAGCVEYSMYLKRLIWELDMGWWDTK